MNTHNLENIHSCLTALGDEMTAASGVRAVSAWLALCEPEVTSYDLDDEDAPYKLRDAIGTDIGWDAAYEGLDGEHDIPRYVDYMVLHGSYGNEWPIPALVAYLNIAKGMEQDVATVAAKAIWQAALERYEQVRESMPSDAEVVEEAA